jgi:hypothetical protein
MTNLPTTATPLKSPHTSTELEISLDILDMLKAAGLTGDALTRTARAWLCTEAEINAWAERTNTPTTNTDHAQREICKLATQLEIAIRQHGRAQTPAFTTMPPEKLLEAIDWYQQQLDDLWPTYDAAWTSPADEHAAILAKWTRLNTLLWEAQLTADIPTVTHQVLTGQSLASRLADALKGATA